MSQILEGIALHDLTEDHLNSLLMLRVPESQRIEYKSSLQLGKESEKRELCKDVSALANSQGGYIFFGIAETNGIPSGIPGITIDDPLKQQLSQVLTSGISPRVQYLEEATVGLRNHNSVLVLKIEPDGYLHQVKYNDDRYYKRVGTITVSMQSSDVETFFRSQGPATRQEQVNEIMTAYYGLLKGRKYGHGVGGKGICALTIVPEVPSYKLDMSNLPSNFALLFQPMYCSGWDWEITARSRFTFARPPKEAVPYAFTEVTELAEVKAFNTLVLENRYGEAQLPAGCIGYVPSGAYERELIISVHRYLNSLKELGVSPPFFLQIALLSVRGYVLYVDPWRFGRQSRLLQIEDIIPPMAHVKRDIEFADLQAVSGVLRPTFDYVWREFGFSKSGNYDSTGKWNLD